MENVEIILQEDPENNRNWVIARLSATKNTITSGLLIKGKSEVKMMGGKEENASITMLFLGKDSSPEKHTLKIQFEKPEDGKKFREEAERLLQ